MQEHAGKTQDTSGRSIAHAQKENKGSLKTASKPVSFTAPALQFSAPIQMASDADRILYYALQARLDAIFGDETLNAVCVAAGAEYPTAKVSAVNEDLAGKVEKADVDVSADLTRLNNWSVSRNTLLASLPSDANYTRLKNTAGFAAQHTEFVAIMRDFFAFADVDVTAMKGKLLDVDFTSTKQRAFNPADGATIYALDKANKITVAVSHKFEANGSIDRPGDLMSPSYSFQLTYGANANFAVLHLHFDYNRAAATYVRANLGLSKLKVSDFGATITADYFTNTPMIAAALGLIAGQTP